MAIKTAAPPNLAETEDVAEFLRIPEKTLVEWRARRAGPGYFKVGRHVRYRWTDVEAWLATRQAGRGVA